MSRGAFNLFFFSSKKGLYALKTRKHKNDVFVCFLCKVNINIHTIKLQLLVNKECPTIFAFRRNSLDLLATTRVIT